jgi:O-antigen ligase
MDASPHSATVPAEARMTALGAHGWPAAFALLFFLGSADQVFATRVGGLNLRWGQALLLAGALAFAPSAWSAIRGAWTDARAVVLAWAAFFGLYALAVALSPAPKLSIVKLAWALFNMGGAALLFVAGTRHREALVRGLVGACATTAAVLWVDALALHWLGTAPLLGLAQDSYEHAGFLQRRPHAFFYEPSYAGASLAFALPTLLVATRSMPRALRLGAPALVTSAIVLTTARTGIVSLGLGAVVAVVLAWRSGHRELVRRLVTIAALSTLALALFFAPTARSRAYGGFLLGPMGPIGVLHRLLPATPTAATVDPGTSEGARASNFREGLARIAERPVLGWGAVGADKPGPGEARLLKPVATNTWVEVGVEAGLLGLLAFLHAIAVTIRSVLRRAAPEPRVLLLAAMAAHLVVNLNFTQTFPRLDYWLLFVAALRLAIPHAEGPPDARARDA